MKFDDSITSTYTINRQLKFYFSRFPYFIYPALPGLVWRGRRVSFVGNGRLQGGMNNGEQRETRNHDANVIGPKIRRLRYALGWSQSKFAIELQLRGLDIGRDVVARIECQTHCVKDKQIPIFARVLGVKVSDLFSGFEP